jgi:type I restriction enzyme R subunit
MTTDTSEKGLETRAISLLLEQAWVENSAEIFNIEFSFFKETFIKFLKSTQPKIVEELELEYDTPVSLKAFSRIRDEISARGIVDVLRRGIQHNQYRIEIYFETPSPTNLSAVENFSRNIFSVARQVHYSSKDPLNSLDLVLSINGLPIFTIELKNQLTRQNYTHAINQYRDDRDPSELIFKFKRTLGHFAVDDSEAWFTTKLEGKTTWFLPFNKGMNDGSGNPVNHGGLKTDYLWTEILQPRSLSDILENYAQVISTVSKKTAKKQEVQVFPRYHQLEVVRSLLLDASTNPVGKKYLIQHSAGSGKSNSIAWLAHQLVGLKENENEAQEKSKFDTVIVVTDRKILDSQISETIKHYAQVSSVVGRAATSSELKELIMQGKKIVISTLQKFPHIIEDIGNEHRNRQFAIIIDEAHSSQGGKAAAALSSSLRDQSEEYSDDRLDELEDLINKAISARQLLSNASYFAFTATPKSKTLELFGVPFESEGKTKFKPFHVYSMKQAIEEGFILDVLSQYTPVKSFYRLSKSVSGDPEFDSKRAIRKLKAYVEGNEHAISMKSELMIDHFLDQVMSQKKIGGKARAMVVTGSIEKAIQYFFSFKEYLESMGSPLKPIVAFSGEVEFKGKNVTESLLNGFASAEIPDRFIEDPYRFLIVADKFQTGYDEPLLHTMYVDKPLNGIRAVQTLSRLNRAHPQKYDCFILDFQNESTSIIESFSTFYRSTVLSDETDPNVLHNLVVIMNRAGLLEEHNIDILCKSYLSGTNRGKIDPHLDIVVEGFLKLDLDDQIEFRSASKTFLKIYSFLSTILPFRNITWEKLSIFLSLLLPKLPIPEDIDLAKGITNTIDMDSYRLEKLAIQSLLIPDSHAEVDPESGKVGKGSAIPTLDKLSNILKEFNDLFGNINWSDADRIAKLIANELPSRVAIDEKFINARANSDKQNAKIEHDAALQRVMNSLMQDQVELFKQFMNNEDFKKWLQEEVFKANYESVA